ncbi:hypothetical protein F2Q69_00027096 [Brassica cretica]|uniref:AT-hook motif nuclear-localized protein n=1 Tax=Brassica cretica TaxID=69181 RepID=A0A8S9RUQ3_BRACR|nr:hypothetical protein F2Q69_00027096 [Brassica cretica]
MDSKETQQQQNRNTAAPLAGPTSTSQAMHNRSDLRQPQPQPDPLVLDGAPNSLPVQQPWMLLGVEQLARARARAYAPPDGGDSGGGANAGPPARGGEEGSLTAHVININAGEDIAAKLVAFMNQEPLHVCVLSALGDVSIAELQSNNSLGLVKYEEWFQRIKERISALTKQRRQPKRDSLDFQRTRDDSKTSMEKTALEKAPTAAPQMKPLSVLWPIKAPVTAPSNTRGRLRAKKKVKIAERIVPRTAETRKRHASLIRLWVLGLTPVISKEKWSRRNSGDVAVTGSDYWWCISEVTNNSSSPVCLDRGLYCCYRNFIPILVKLLESFDLSLDSRKRSPG